MDRFKFTQSKFGEYDTIILSDEKTNSSMEIALQGATLLSWKIPIEGKSFNIIDGFATPEELKAAKGARCWIMTPFANRIPEGKYSFEGKDYKLKPLPPRTQVIHGLTAYQIFDVEEKVVNNEFAEVVLSTKNLRPGAFEGYPFSLDVFVKFKFEEGKLSIEITGENVGDKPLPFHCGWHPYFKTSDKGIEHLVFTLDADEIVLLDENFIPLPGKAAYGQIENFPKLNFSSGIPEEERIINGRVLDNCFAAIHKDEKGISESSIYDPENDLKITMFQKGGVTLAFSGDSLNSRKRKSVAIEPMQFITNAYNRDELKDELKVMPGEKSVFNFGVNYTGGKK